MHILNKETNGIRTFEWEDEFDIDFESVEEDDPLYRENEITFKIKLKKKPENNVAFYDWFSAEYLDDNINNISEHSKMLMNSGHWRECK